MAKQYDFIQQLIKEAESYRNMGHIERLAQDGQLQYTPLQPLAMAFRQMNAQQVARYLPQLSGEQREACLDLDLWHRDQLDVREFPFWIEVYHKVSSWDLKLEFVQSEQFALYFKGMMTISTFDQEDPQYPEHKKTFFSPTTTCYWSNTTSPFSTWMNCRVYCAFFIPVLGWKMLMPTCLKSSPTPF